MTGSAGSIVFCALAYHACWSNRTLAAAPLCPQSLLATGLTQPEHVLQHCLALYRKADLAALRQYLPDSYAAALAPPEQAATAEQEGGSSGGSGQAAAAPSSSSSSSSSSGGSGSASASSSRAAQAPALPVGPWFKIRESGPLAPLAGVLDVGARRVLPGHLLRRSQVGLFSCRMSDMQAGGKSSWWQHVLRVLCVAPACCLPAEM